MSDSLRASQCTCVVHLRYSFLMYCVLEQCQFVGTFMPRGGKTYLIRINTLIDTCSMQLNTAQQRGTLWAPEKRVPAFWVE